MSRRVAMDCCRMNRQRTMKRVSGANEFHHLSPIVDLLPIVVWESWCEIPGKIRLTGRTPHNRPRAVPGDEIAPMRSHFFNAHPGHEITPRTHDARCEPLLDQIAQPLVCGVKILRPDAGVICFP